MDKSIDKGNNQKQINKEEKIQFLSPNESQPISTKQKQSKNNKREPALDYSSYPYNSSKEKNKKERASVVKERILNCGTSNELIELKISEREIDWLKKNIFSLAEKEQIKEIELMRQGNLFSIDSSQEIVYFDLNEVMGKIDKEMKRIGWSKEKGKSYLSTKSGVKSRHKLTDDQLIEFLNYLKRKQT